MKRIIAVLLMLLLLAACQPTPDHDFVINKGDDIVEQKLSATPVPAQPVEDAVGVDNKTEAPTGETEEPKTAAALAPQTFPDRWDEDTEKISDHLTIAVHADVVQRADGLYPVWRTRGREVSAEEAAKLVSALLPAPTEVFTQEPTKDDIKREMERYLEEANAKLAWQAAGRPNDGVDRDETELTQEEVDAQLKEYAEQIEKAPEKLETTPVSDYSGLKLNRTSGFTLSDGGKVSVSWRKEFVAVSKGCSNFGYNYYRYYYEDDKRFDEPNAKVWKDVKMDKAEAEKILQTEMERLGFTDFAVKSAVESNLLDSVGGKMHYVTGGWTFKLIRNYGGYPLTNVPYAPVSYARIPGTGDDSGHLMNKPIRDEEVEVLIDENGIQYFSYSAPKDILELVNESVELLPFEDVKRIAKNAVSVSFPFENWGDRQIDLEIYKMLLTTFTLHVKNSDDYYEMPCWVVFFDGMHSMEPEIRERERNDEDLQHDVVILNAVDGSIIHNDYGY